MLSRCQEQTDDIIFFTDMSTKNKTVYESDTPSFWFGLGLFGTTVARI